MDPYNTAPARPVPPSDPWKYEPVKRDRQESRKVITVIYKGSLSQQRKPAASMGDARRMALELVDRIGPDAWQHTIVQDSSGYEHRPAELWGEISTKL